MCIEQLQCCTDEDLVLGVIARKFAANPAYDEGQGVIDEPLQEHERPVRTEAGFGRLRVARFDTVSLGVCGHCHARILWGITERDKRIPLEVAPAPAKWLDVQRVDDGLFARAGSQGIGYRYHACPAKAAGRPVPVLTPILTDGLPCEMGDEDGCREMAGYLLESASYTIALGCCETHAEEQRHYFGAVTR